MLKSTTGQQVEQEKCNKYTISYCGRQHGDLQAGNTELNTMVGKVLEIGFTKRPRLWGLETHSSITPAINILMP